MRYIEIFRWITLIASLLLLGWLFAGAFIHWNGSI